VIFGDRAYNLRGTPTKKLARRSPIRSNIEAYGGYHLPRTDNQNRKRSLVPIRAAPPHSENRAKTGKIPSQLKLSPFRFVSFMMPITLYYC